MALLEILLTYEIILNIFKLIFILLKVPILNLITISFFYYRFDTIKNCLYQE